MSAEGKTILQASNSSRFLFIGGLHRSGTSLLHRCLGDHPDISIFRQTESPEDEGQHLQTVYPAARVFGGPGEFGFHSGAHLTESSDFVSAGNAEQMISDWSEYWDEDRAVLAEKSPPNLIRMRFLQALFPDARFVILIRHPIAVSLATKKWTDVRFGRLLKHWVYCHRLFEIDRPHINNLMAIRYEDFVSRPQQILNDLYRFVGLSSVPVRQEVKNSINEKYWTLYETIRSHDLLRQVYHRYIQARFESRVRRFGYSLSPGEYLLQSDPRTMPIMATPRK